MTFTVYHLQPFYRVSEFLDPEKCRVQPKLFRDLKPMGTTDGPGLCLLTETSFNMNVEFTCKGFAIPIKCNSYWIIRDLKSKISNLSHNNLIQEELSGLVLLLREQKINNCKK